MHERKTTKKKNNWLKKTETSKIKIGYNVKKKQVSA